MAPPWRRRPARARRTARAFDDGGEGGLPSREQLPEDVPVRAEVSNLLPLPCQSPTGVFRRVTAMRSNEDLVLPGRSRRYSFFDKSGAPSGAPRRSNLKSTTWARPPRGSAEDCSEIGERRSTTLRFDALDVSTRFLPEVTTRRTTRCRYRRLAQATGTESRQASPNHQGFPTKVV